LKFLATPLATTVAVVVVVVVTALNQSVQDDANYSDERIGLCVSVCVCLPAHISQKRMAELFT